MVLLFGRLGNKDNDIKYFKDKLPLDVKNVVEPFGGTFSVIRNIFNTKDYKKFVNDNDKYLIEIYKSPKKYSNLANLLNNIAKKCLNENNNVDHKKFINIIENDEKIKKKINKNPLMLEYWKKEKIIRGTMIKVIKNIDHKEIINLMNKINFSFDNYLSIINRFKNEENTFIFIDPPYLFSNNKQYDDQNIDGDCTNIIYELYEILKDKNTKAKIMIIINDLKILRWLFKDYIKGEYKKIYQIGKRKDNHLIICNY